MQNTFIKILLIVLLTILIFSQFSNAQQFGKLRGVVTDSTNGEALAFCNIYVNELKTGASSNERGLFIINSIPAKKSYTIVVSYVGYDTKIFTAFIDANKITDVNINLKPLSIELQTVEKIGERYIEKNVSDLGIEKISVKQLEVLPKGVETDIIRSLQYIPGVSTTGDVSARYYVRGGSSDQNLVLLNGVTLYGPFHSMGLFSVIDPDVINSIEFFKGGFASEYSGRLSSILNVISKDGNKNRFGGSASASFLTGKGVLQGPIPNGSFIISGRFSYSDKILKQFLDQQTVPIDFYDISAKINYSSSEIFNNAKFNLFTFLTSDKIVYDDPAREEYYWKNNLIGFEWLQIYDAPFFSRLGISLSNFEARITPNKSNLKPLENKINDVTLSFDLNTVFNSKDEADFGLMIKLLDSKLSAESRTGIKSDIDRFAGNISVYGKYKLLRFNNFGIDIGTRFNVTGINSNTAGSFEPRFSFIYRPFERLSFKGTAGIYLQEMTTLTDEDEIISIFDPWIVIPDYLDPAKGLSYSAGVQYDFSEYVNIQIEGYRRKFNNIPVINEKKYFSSDPDLVSGSQESYGWEIGFNLNERVYSISTSYSLSWAYKTVDDYTYYPKYDTRQGGNIILELNPGNAWNFSTVWSFYSGLPYTEIISYYDKYSIQNPFNILPGAENYSPYLILAEKNLGRLPAYHRLDLGVSKKIILEPTIITISLNAINVYNRQNIFYYERDTGRRVNMLPFLFTATIKIEI